MKQWYYWIFQMFQLNEIKRTLSKTGLSDSNTNLSEFIKTWHSSNIFLYFNLIIALTVLVVYFLFNFQQVNTLSVNARLAVKGLHTKKSGDFVRACAAYCFITIPSVISEKTRLQLYLLSGQVAIFNQCFGQGKDSRN